VSRTILSSAALLVCACTLAWTPTASAAGAPSEAGVRAQAGTANKAGTQASTANETGTRAQAGAAHTVELTAAFSPERLGAGTTIRFGLRISTPAGRAPSPVTALEVLLPAGLSIATSDLGLETCGPSELEQDGLAGCPPDSLMGRGSAAAEVPFGASFVTEQAPIAVLSGPLQDGHPQLLFFAEGEYPVLANIMFAALVLSAKAPFGGLLSTTPPLIPSVPNGPDVALVRLATTIGAKGITYYEHAHDRTIAFHPRGIVLPRNCPRGGFAFAVHLGFQDGTQAGAGAVVPCPRGG
jgi:hypothetical protein